MWHDAFPAGVRRCLGRTTQAFNKRRFLNQLKITKTEVKQENKDQQISPHMKPEMRRRQAELSRSRMMAAVTGADVVVTNPTHLAIALKHSPGDPRRRSWLAAVYRARRRRRNA